MVTPMGIPHAPSRDDVYKGFFIPKDSIVLANSWAILHDPEAYPDPEEFKPERFLNEDGSARDDPTLSLIFGMGRGSVLDVTLSMTQFYLAKARDEDGNEIPVKAETISDRGMIVHPKRFECSILPRDKVAGDLISANALT
ncbi:cytochrome P450 [Russula vinacea]|nr:cytochrome P450 [Russula vinacea]